MKCLACGTSSWTVYEAKIDPIVNGQQLKFKVLMFKCEKCGQTSMDDDLYETFTKKCLAAYRKSRSCELNDGIIEND